MGFSRNDDKWMERFHLLEEFIGQEGRMPSVSEGYRGEPLGNWVANQKAFYRKGILSGKRKELWESIGGSSYKTKQTESQERKWFANFEVLKEYVNVNGMLPPDAAEYKGIRIGAWLSAQKVRLRKERISELQVNLLDGLCPDWSAELRPQKWFFAFDVLKEYVSETGTLPRFDAEYKGVKLGAWLTRQRHLCRNELLSDERRSLLESVGVDFENDFLKVRQEKWNEKLDLLKEYVAIAGVLPGKDVEYRGVALGRWLKDKIDAYWEGELPEYHFESLCEVFELAQSFSDGSLDRLISCAEGKRLQAKENSGKFFEHGFDR